MKYNEIKHAAFYTCTYKFYKAIDFETTCFVL